MARKIKGPRKKELTEASIASAFSSIELFNRPGSVNRISLSLITNVRAWEQLGKAFLLKKKRDIYFDRGERSYSAEKVIRILYSDFNVLSPGEAKTLQQIISLRNEAMHSDLNYIPDDLAAHLLYFSLKSFRGFVKDHFPSYGKGLNSNFISINFDQVYTYSARINKIISSSRGRIKDNRILYLLERGLHYARHGNEMSQQDWVQKVKALKGRRITKSALYLKKYAAEHNNVLFITVEAPSKYGKAEVTISKGSHSAKTRVTVVASDPDDSHPYLTSELAVKLKRGRNFVSRAIKELGLKGNKDYHLAVRSGKNSQVQRYSDRALKRLKKYFNELES